MRQRARKGLGGRVWAVLARMAVSALLLMEPPSEAHAERFSDAIQKALDNSCDGLAGPKRGSLDSLCAASGPAGATTSVTGASIATQTVRQQGADERRIRLRLEELRQAGAGGGVLGAGADPGSQLGKLGVFV